MLHRRRFLQHSAFSIAASAGLSPLLVQAGSVPYSNPAWHMPDEADPHTATWMAFGAGSEVWGDRLLRGARENLALIARTIAAYEPVHMLVRQDEMELAYDLCGKRVDLLSCGIDDLWMRDTGPVFVKDQSGQLAGVDFNFNGWGEKQDYAQDALVASYVTRQTNTQRLTTFLKLEGGGIEVDGEGTAIITESCVLNHNRNPGISKAQCDQELRRLLGVQKIIWLPGIAGRDITDGHTDFYARFAAPGVVVAGFDPDPQSEEHGVTQTHLKLLRNAVDAKGRRLRVLRLDAPSSVRPQYENKEFAAGYINFYVCNGAVIMPQFGDLKADRNARDTLRDLFPKRDIVALNIDAIAAGGGGIHCTTQQEPDLLKEHV